MRRSISQVAMGDYAAGMRRRRIADDSNELAGAERRSS
jgi:hypothetical protein